MLRPLVDHAGLAGVFLDLLSVDSAKIYKPSPIVYQLAVDKTGLRKEAIGFVSSNSWDIAGAASFGFQTIWINRAGNPAARLGMKPWATLNGLSQLVQLCKGSS